MLILHAPGPQPPQRLTQALQKWLDRTGETGVYFTYELRCEQAPAAADERAAAALLDAVMEQALELCSRFPPGERWLTLLFDCAPEGLRIECAGPGEEHPAWPACPEREGQPGGVPMEFYQDGGDFYLRLKLDLKPAG